MIQIKFKAWDDINKQMILHENIGVGLKNINKPQHGKRQFYYRQFTGLKDKDGTEIYEGDILHFVTYKGGGFATAGIDVYKVIRYGEFCVNNNTLYEYVGFYAESVTSKDSIKYTLSHGAVVIGNIYENGDIIDLINKRICLK